MKAGIRIRRATSDDFESVYQFINGLERFVFDPQSQHTIFLNNLNNPDIIYIVAEKNDEAVGFLSCHVQLLLHHGGKVGEIQELFVKEEFRNHDIGGKLVRNLINLCKEKEIYQLEVTSNKLRPDAHRFYLNEGFRDSHKKFTMEFDGNPLKDIPM